MDQADERCVVSLPLSHQSTRLLTYTGFPGIILGMSKSYTDELRERARLSLSTADDHLSNRETLIKAMTGKRWGNATPTERIRIAIAGAFFITLFGALLSAGIGLLLVLAGVLVVNAFHPHPNSPEAIQLAAIFAIFPSLALGHGIAIWSFWYRNIRPHPAAARLRSFSDEKLLAAFDGFREKQDKLYEAFTIAQYQAEQTALWNNYYDRLYRLPAN